MMSKKQWFALLCMYVVYLMLGSVVFYEIEKRAELHTILEDKKEKLIIEDLLVKHYVPTEEHESSEIFEKLETYCGKPLNPNMTEEEYTLKWDFYHAVFFVLTVVTTVGYGNLAPTQPSDRIFMMFYAVIGMPLNGLVIITLGDFFGKSFTKLYDRWKTQRVQHTLATLGLVGQILLYLIPGITFFVILPSIIIKIYEGWPYDVAVFYSFVTVTTIGFGDYVAGMKENGHGIAMYTIYKIFLLIWIISGLAYIVMVFGFINRGIHSKKMRVLEHKIAQNIKKTNYRIREEFRAVLNEYLLMRVKRVYREKFVYVPTIHGRSQSCPDLTIYVTKSPTMMRKRAFSAVANVTPPEITRVQSESDLQRIDKDKTFSPSSAMVEPSQLLMRVVNALGSFEPPDLSNSPSPTLGGINMFSDEAILASERPGSGFSTASSKISNAPKPGSRPRAASEYRIPYIEKISVNNDLTWYGPAATKRLEELRKQTNKEKYRNKSLPPQLHREGSPQTLLDRFKNTFLLSSDNKQKSVDVERQSYLDSNINYNTNVLDDQLCGMRQSRRESTMYSIPEDEQVLEETSIADFLRALTAISVPDMLSNDDPPKRKLGTACLTPPESTSPTRPRLESPGLSHLFRGRKTSLMPPAAHDIKYRRFSLRPTESGNLEPPPYSSQLETTNVPKKTIISQNRRFSLRPVSETSSPVQRRALKLKQSFRQTLRSRFSRDDSSA